MEDFEIHPRMMSFENVIEIQQNRIFLIVPLTKYSHGNYVRP